MLEYGHDYLIFFFQGQNLLYIQAFDDRKKQELSSILEKEKWKSSNMELEVILKQVQPIPFLMEAFELKEKENKVVMKDSTFFELQICEFYTC